MHAPVRRGLAATVDFVLTALLAQILILPIWYMSNNPASIAFLAFPLLHALVWVFLSLGLRGATPGKRWLRLQLSGSGCLVCRELRRSGWYLIWGINALLLPWRPDWVALVVEIGVLAILIMAYFFPLARRQTDFPHNTATGFAVSNRE